MKRSLLLAVAALSVAAPTLAPLAASAQDRPEGGRHGGGRQGGGRGDQPGPAAQPAPQAAPAQAPQPSQPSAAAISARAAAQAGMDRRRVFTGPNDPAATPQDRAQLWGNRGRGPESAPQERAQAWGNRGRQDGQASRGDQRGVRPDGRDFQADRRDPRPYGQQYFGGQTGLGERRDVNRDRGDFRGDRRDSRQDYRQDGQRFRGGWYAGDRRAFNYNGRTFYRFRSDPYRWGNYTRYQNYRWARGAVLPSYFLLPDYFITDYYAFGLQPAPYGYQWVRVGYDVLLVNEYSGQIVDVVPNVFDY